MDSQQMTYKDRRFEIAVGVKGFPTCKAWRGKAKKHYAYIQFRSKESLNKWILSEMQSADRAETCKAEREQQRTEAIARTLETVKVGTILHYSWGYEQTNATFLEVVARSGRSVTLRPIAASLIPDSGCGPMSGRVKPVPGKYTGEPFKKLLGPCGVRMAHGIAAPTDPSQSHFCSWYA